MRDIRIKFKPRYLDEKELFFCVIKIHIDIKYTFIKTQGL